MNINGASWRNRAPLIRSGESNRDLRRRHGSFWGASKHSPIISQRKKSNSSSSAVTHMYAAFLAKDKTLTKPTTVKEKRLLPEPPAGFYKAKGVFCFFFFFSLSICKSKSSLSDINLLLQASTWTVEPGGRGGSRSHRLPVSFFWTYLFFHHFFVLSDCVMR